MRKSTFIKFLKEAPEEDLRKELENLYTKFPDVKEHYVMELGSEEDRRKIIDKVKKKLRGMYDRYKFRARKSKATALIKHIDRISIFDHELADLYLFHAEMCASWMRNYNIFPNIWTHYMDSLEKGLNLVLRSMSEDDFQNRIFNLVDRSDFGWDTQEAVVELVDEILGDDFLADK
jgi:hypothetical protein